MSFPFHLLNQISSLIQHCRLPIHRRVRFQTHRHNHHKVIKHTSWSGISEQLICNIFPFKCNKSFSEFHDLVGFPWNVSELTSNLTECASSLLARSGVVPPRGQPVWPAGFNLFGRHMTFGLTDELLWCAVAKPVPRVYILPSCGYI